MATYESKFQIKDRVFIDFDPKHELIGTVTGVQFRLQRDPIIEVGWMHNGDAKSAWLEEWRLEKKKD